jgi:hypothetical protein
LDIITTHWQVELNYPLDKLTEDQPTTRRKWLETSLGIYFYKYKENKKQRLTARLKNI